MKYEKIYHKLKKQYTDEEIVDAMIISADLTEEEALKLSTEMKEIRFLGSSNKCNICGISKVA